MTEFLASAHSLDLVLSLIGLEAIVLIVLWRMRRCPLNPITTVLILAPGTCLLLAARAVLAGAPGVWVPCLFLLALVVHLTDLRRQWRDRNRANPAAGDGA